MKNLKLTYHRNGDYFIPNLVLDNDDYKDYQLGKYGYLRLDYLKNHKISIEELIDFAKKQKMDNFTIKLR